MPPVTVVGIGDDGCAGISSRAINAISSAQILAGGERQMAFFPEFQGQRIILKGGLGRKLAEIDELSLESNVVVLASGDPLFFGIGSLILKKIGTDRVEIIPHISSMQLAFAKAGRRWDDAIWISLHGRSREGFLTRLKRERKIACFTDEQNHPAALAAYLLENSAGAMSSWVCENLGGPTEQVRYFSSLQELSRSRGIGPLNILILERSDPLWRPPAVFLNHHEDQYAKRLPKKGLITKKEIRLFSIGELEVARDSIIWDVGAASGSVAIECALLASEGRAYAIEVDRESLAYCRQNIRQHGVDNVRVIEGQAPEVFSAIEEDPDAVFIGGSKGSLRQIATEAYRRLPPGGRLVVNAITFENVEEAYRSLRELPGHLDISLLNISRGVPLARYMRYEAQNPIHIFSLKKAADLPPTDSLPPADSLLVAKPAEKSQATPERASPSADPDNR